jgi:hypothetical protein
LEALSSVMEDSDEDDSEKDHEEEEESGQKRKWGCNSLRDVLEEKMSKKEENKGL